jgi:hypothetical protein
MKKNMQSLAKALSEKIEGSPEKKAVAQPVKEEAQGAKCPTCGHCPPAEAEEEDKE